ncbi:MAG: metal-dependent hydrolase, partial [Desulfomonile tiedjei]|nr:metal-dependent hydrolase [Desulfomonile tiedjei]
MPYLVLDAHAHCGLTLPYEDIAREWRLGEINGGVLFSPVEEIYNRNDPFFTDSPQYAKSRASVHRYLLERAQDGSVFPYYFVWNDFHPVPEGFAGIKWHRHSDEPVYSYGTPECTKMIEEICRRRLPVILEEEFHNTTAYLREISGRTVVIVPHMGALNGGYYRLKKAGVFEAQNVWVDTALGGREEIRDFASTYGMNRIVFGSDYPFGT